VAELAPAAPAGLSTIIHRLLEKDRARRYPSAIELLADLRRLASGSRPMTVPAEAAPAMLGRVRRRRGALLGAALGAGLLAALAIWLAGRQPRSTERPAAGSPIRRAIPARIISPTG
jgi:ferric-dicitrate binding protein FerR (iron transport regulator)